MNNKYYNSQKDNQKRYGRQQDKDTLRKKSDEDLIIEENTIYEIDRDCVERLKRKRRNLK
ncbi:MAG: hypothetical protein GX237_03325 [Clostridiales bacterium]|nr:hypothetical protein [Clostridiales bacterium]